MKLRYALGLAVAIAFAPAARAGTLSADQKQELGGFIREYLVSHPEVLREAIEALDKHDKETAKQAQEKAVADLARPDLPLEIPGRRRQSQGERDAGRVLRLQLPFLQGRAARRRAADEGGPEPSRGAEGFSGPRAGLGRGRPRRLRRAQPASRRQASGISTTSCSACTGPSARRRRSPSPRSWASTWTGSKRTWRARTSTPA